MKKLLIINGSPNSGGNTSKIISTIIEGLNKNEIEITEVNCYNVNIRPCVDCKCCSQMKGCCSIKDDMEQIYTLLKEADCIILGSPMYFGMFPAPLKVLIDRCQLIWSEKYIFNKLLKEKEGIFIFDGGSSWQNMFLPMETIGKYFFNTINCTLIHSLYVNNTDEDNDYISKNRESIVKCTNIISGTRI